MLQCINTTLFSAVLALSCGAPGTPGTPGTIGDASLPALLELDCNRNGIDDAVDIATGGSSDVNLNGIPDECEAPARER